MNETILPAVLMTLGAGTPLIFAGLGELVTEKSGVLNLGVEGMMLVGAIGAFITTSATGSLWLGVLAGLLAGAAMALLFGFITLTLKANQVATGLALAIFGTGVSAFLGKGHVGVALRQSATASWVDGVPLLGAFLQAVHPLVALSWALFAAVAWFLYRSRPGLVLRAVGESPDAAHAIGYPVIAIRYAATTFGGAMAGVAGAYLSLVYAPLWLEGMTAGRGWIALALVVFATWRPQRLVFGAYLFGGITIAQFFAQGAGIGFASQAMSMLPYLVTVAVLVLISRNTAMVRLNAPVALGKPFHATA